MIKNIFIFILLFLSFLNTTLLASTVTLEGTQLEQDRLLTALLTSISTDNGTLLRDSGGFSSGGGGNAVVCFKESGSISEVSLLDYVEGLRKDNSLEKAIYLNGSTVAEKIASAFDKMGTRWPLLAKSLKKRALIIEKEMDQYLLSAVDGKLTPIVDMDLTFVPSLNALGDKCQIVRFAVQEKEGLSGQRKFSFVKELYNHPKTSIMTKAGIIIHEVLYEEAIKYGALNSNFIRWFNYLISSTTYELFSPSDFRTLELDEGAEFLKGHSVDYLRRGSPYGDFDSSFREFENNEDVFTFTNYTYDTNRGEAECFSLGLCEVEKGIVISKADSATDFYMKYKIRMGGEQLVVPVSDLAKAKSEGICHPDGGCVGAKVKVQKYGFNGNIFYEGTIVGVFGEGDFAIKVLTKTLIVSSSLSAIKKELVKTDNLILFAKRSSVRWY